MIAKASNYNPVKLETDIDLFWKSQILATIKAYDLVQFIIKSEKPPAKYIQDPRSSNPDDQKVNEEYLVWLKFISYF